MILVLGPEGTREHDAALALKELIVRSWPAMRDDPTHDVRIVAGAKCHGQRVRDVDILVLASFGPGLEFTPFLPFTLGGGRLLQPKAVTVESLCLVIEVKDHPPDAVRFVGTAVEVRYQQRWHNASEQNDAQMYSVKAYLEQHGIRPPRITPLLWLRNVPGTGLPPRPHPAFGSPVTWDMILNIIAQMTPPDWDGERWVLTAGSDRAALPRAADLFTRVLNATHLDRLRVERITQREVDLAPLRQVVGEKLLMLRGRGGTGKTMRLLQMAADLLQRQGARILILTYNKALVADIRRLLAILGIPDDITGGTIHIQTVHSFLYSVLRGLGILGEGGTQFLERYEQFKDEALEMLRSGAIVPADIEDLLGGDAEAFRWDYVFVDEGQDWPTNERDLLFALYPPEQVVVADGVDQLVRSHTPTDWRAGRTRQHWQVVSLSASLRMKAGLARFVSAVARHLGLLHTEWEPNLALPGGRIIVVDGAYFEDRHLHDALVRRNSEDRNAPVDMLFCVPPSLVLRASGSPPHSVAADVFTEWGYRVWDGASADVRDSYPTEVDQLRIVQYESCRGLEGWIGVNLGIDTFYTMKLAAAEAAVSAGAGAPGAFTDDRSAAMRFAARWLLIPLTRAIDTLVIQLDDESSPVKTALEAAARECGDYVDWRSTR